MIFDEQFSELQKLFAKKDLITESRKSSSSDFMELVLLKRKNLKYKIYEEPSHILPHIHIEYGHDYHAASYEIKTGNRITGNLPNKYDYEVSGWINNNRNTLIKIWDSLQHGENPREYMGELIGDE